MLAPLASGTLLLGNGRNCCRIKEIFEEVGHGNQIAKQSKESFENIGCNRDVLKDFSSKQ